jgi:ZIP family zinc transporter
MEGRSAVEPVRGRTSLAPTWLLGLVPLALIALAVAVFAALDGPGLGDRAGPPAEELEVERTVLKPGSIELTVRNDGPDPVHIAQVVVNDSFADLDAERGAIGRLDSSRIKIPYPWVEGESYQVMLLTSTGGTIEHEIPVAVESPDTGLGFYGLMALLGFYVGVLPVTLGMLWLPFVRRIGGRWLRVLMALTIGLLGFLVIDATLEGIDVASQGPKAFGGTALVFLGGAVSYLALTAVETGMASRGARQ